MSTHISYPDDSPEFSTIAYWRNKHQETGHSEDLYASARHWLVVGHTDCITLVLAQSVSISRSGWLDSSSLIPKSLQYFSRVFATCSTMLQVMLTTFYRQSVELLFPFTLGHVRTSKLDSTAEVSTGVGQPAVLAGSSTSKASETKTWWRNERQGFLCVKN